MKRLAELNTGKPLSAEHKAKLRAFRLGKPLTPEHKAAVVRARRARAEKETNS